MHSFPQTIKIAVVLHPKSCRWPHLGLSAQARCQEGLQLGRCSAQQELVSACLRCQLGLLVEHHSLSAAGAPFTPAGFSFPHGSGTTDFTVPDENIRFVQMRWKIRVRDFPKAPRERHISAES